MIKIKQSEIIKLTRKKAGLTQKQLAQKTGLSVATIQGYEQNKYYPKIDSLNKIAMALSVSIGDLAGDDSLSIYQSELRELPETFDQNVKSSLKKLSQTVSKGLNDFAAHTHDIVDSDAKVAFLLYDYEKLNSEGRHIACERIKELTEIKRYTDPDDKTGDD